MQENKTKQQTHIQNSCKVLTVLHAAACPWCVRDVAGRGEANNEVSQVLAAAPEKRHRDASGAKASKHGLESRHLRGGTARQLLDALGYEL